MPVPRICSLILLAGLLYTPAGSAADPQFEVATVKPFDGSRGGWSPDLKGGPGTPDPNRITYTNFLKRILMTAYGVGNDFISGPAWLDTEMYAITATVPTGATKDEMALMLQNLLKTRLQIVLHRETRDVPLYELTVTGKGPQLKEYVEGSFAAGGRGMRGGLDSPFQYVSNGAEHLVGNQARLAQLTNYLSHELKRPVVDKTGLTGVYNYNLDYAFAATADDALPASAPDLTTALREQLGLKLTAKEGPLEIIVIDRAEKIPLEN